MGLEGRRYGEKVPPSLASCFQESLENNQNSRVEGQGLEKPREGNLECSAYRGEAQGGQPGSLQKCEGLLHGKGVRLVLCDPRGHIQEPVLLGEALQLNTTVL